MNLGSDARWKSDDTNGCTLEILDENAVVSVGSSNRKTPIAGNNEQCHRPVRELANSSTPPYSRSDQLSHGNRQAR